MLYEQEYYSNASNAFQTSKMKAKTISASDDFESFISRVSDWIYYVEFWKKNSYTIRQKFFNILIIVGLLSLVSLLIISELIDIKYTHSFPNFVKRFDPILFHLYGLLKWIISMIRANSFENLIERLKKCHKLCLMIASNEDRHKLHEKTIKLKRKLIKFSYIWFFICIGGTTHWTLNPLFYDLFDNLYGNHSINSSYIKHLPYEGFYPWNLNETSYYLITLIFQSISAFACGIEIAAYDILNVILLSIICMNIQHLNDTLIENKENLSHLNKKQPNHMIVTKLKLCVLHHQEILGFLEKWRIASSFQMFTLCFISTIALCLTSLEASTIKIDSSIECIMQLTSMAEYWLGINASLFCYCYLADKIKELALETANAFYSCDWEQLLAYNNNKIDNDHKKELTDMSQIIEFSIMRAQKPIILTGGLFYVLSLETFKALIGFALSNALVLRQLSEKT